ncbi:transporter, SSS family [Peptostreptococcaceae bacterium oral taxon 113 str. W5053]|nr:transporter, SSS family [Peptostreptococcaceae bacterium oral taxon 113 str. W5053]
MGRHKMERSSIILILAFSVAIVVISLLIGLWAKRKANTAQAFFGGTGMFGPVAVGLASMSGIASAFAVVGVPGIIYSTGNAMTFWMLSGAAFAMSYLILGKKVRAIAEIAPISSLGDICDLRFNNNRWIKGVMSLVICLGCISYLAAQISAGSTMFSHLLGFPPIVTGLIIFGILTIYTAISGEVGGILTQAFQGFIMVLSSIAMLIAFVSITGGFGNILKAVGSISEVANADGSVVKKLGPDFLNAWGIMPKNISLTWMLIPILGCVGQPQVLTRIYAVKDPRDLPKAGIVTAISHTIVGFVAVTTAYGALYLVATGKVAPFVKGDLAFYVFSDYAGVTIQLLGYAAVLAAAMSSASMFLTSTSTLLSKDLPSALGISINPKKQINISRTFMVVLGLVSIVVSIYSSEMVAILGTFGWGTLVSGTFPVFIIGLLWERANEKGVLTGMIVSFILNVLSLAKFKWPGGLPAYVSITAISVALTIFVSLLTRKQQLSENMREVIRL